MKVESRKSLVLLFLLSSFLFGAEGISVYNVKDYGAVADGKTKITDVFKSVIAKIKKDGGGTVYVPPGEYLTGPIHFVDNMTLYLEAGATLNFSTDFDDYYPMVQVRFQGIDFKNFSPLLYAYKVKNIAIKGRGKIDGHGEVWMQFNREFRKVYKESGEKNRNINKWQKKTWEANYPNRVQHGGFMRPQLFLAYDCKDVLLEDIYITNTPFWTCHFVLCENVNVTGVTIKNPLGNNPDGINPESCKNVHISNCHIDTDDDCITIKAGKHEAARWDGNSCENITITNCTLISGASGVGIGSEMSGSVRNVTISNCVIVGTSGGIYIKTIRGRGGVVENITVNNLVINNLRKSYAIGLDMMYYIKTEKQPVSDDTPKFRNIHFSNITGTGNKKGIFVRGLEEMYIENVSFTNINLETENGFSCEFVKGIRLNNVTITPDTGSVFLGSNILDLEIDGLSTKKNMKDVPFVKLKNTTNAFIHSTFLPQGIKTFMELSGKNTHSIHLGLDDVRRFSDRIIFKDGATTKAINQ
ncbi:MAG: glycoside hydrolase family 28 protein [Melioribacteraceae bacterium]